MRYLNVHFGLCDHLNPACGYQLTICDGVTGRELLHTGKAPDTGYPLLTAADCLRVIDWYHSTSPTADRW